MKLKRVLNVVIAMVTTVVIELQQVSTYTDKIPPHDVGPQHESGSVYFRASSSVRCMICSQTSHVFTQFILHVLNFKFPRSLICNLHLAS